MTDDDRDKRTVFVQQIAARVESHQLKRFFETVGEVVDAQIVKDRITLRSKGWVISSCPELLANDLSVGYVEFKNEESVAKAIELTGQKLKGVPIIAQLAEAEKNRASKAAAAEGKQNSNSNNQAPFHRLYVGNIHFSITEDDLKAVFGPYGDLTEVQLQKDDAGKSRGYGFIQYVKEILFLTSRLIC